MKSAIPIQLAKTSSMPDDDCGSAAQYARCSACRLRSLCLPGGLDEQDTERLEHLKHTRKIKRGESLYRMGDSFHAIYAVRSGFLKTYVNSEDGREQVTGFHMAAEILGADGIHTDTHQVHAVALEDSEVCVLPFAMLEELVAQVRSLQRQFYKLLGREITHDQNVMMLLGSMRADERVAAFLLNLSQRFHARGYAASDFNLRMKREEIGSYLGLKFETVSRVFSKLQDDKLIAVDQKNVKILDIENLGRGIGMSAARSRTEAALL
jgi:CRP/FNR family transcriptional regulator